MSISVLAVALEISSPRKLYVQALEFEFIGASNSELPLVDAPAGSTIIIQATPAWED